MICTRSTSIAFALTLALAAPGALAACPHDAIASPPAGAGPTFGTAVAVSGDALVISEPTAGTGAGCILRIRKRPDLLTSEWSELIDEALEQVQENPLATALAAGGDVAIVGDHVFVAAEFPDPAARGDVPAVTLGGFAHYRIVDEPGADPHLVAETAGDTLGMAIVPGTLNVRAVPQPGGTPDEMYIVLGAVSPIDNRPVVNVFGYDSSGGGFPSHWDAGDYSPSNNVACETVVCKMGRVELARGSAQLRMIVGHGPSVPTPGAGGAVVVEWDGAQYSESNFIAGPPSSTITPAGWSLVDGGVVAVGKAEARDVRLYEFDDFGDGYGPGAVHAVVAQENPLAQETGWQDAPQLDRVNGGAEIAVRLDYGVENETLRLRKVGDVWTTVARRERPGSSAGGRLLTQFPAIFSSVPGQAVRIDEFTAYGDVTGDRQVNFDDLNAVLGAWNTSDLTGDADASGFTDFDDLNLVLSNWATVCP